MERIFCDLCDGEINTDKDGYCVARIERCVHKGTNRRWVYVKIEAHRECFEALPLPKLKWEK